MSKSDWISEADVEFDEMLKIYRRFHAFLGENTYVEMLLKIDAGQTVGQAFINAGDHADLPYHYEMDFKKVMQINTWPELAHALDVYLVSRPAGLLVRN